MERRRERERLLKRLLPRGRASLWRTNTAIVFLL
jgi:hypothetical protein